MKKKTILLVIILPVVFLAVLTVHNSNPRVIISRVFKNEEAQKGNLKYRVYFLGVLPVGEAVFNVRKIEQFEGKRVYHLSATAGTLKYFARFFSCQVALDSYVDARELTPMVFKQKITIRNKESVNKEISYNQKEGFMAIGDTKRVILPDTQDSLSAMFKLMRYDFAKERDFRMNINPYKKNYVFVGKAGSEALSVDGKKYETFLFKGRIMRQENNPYHQSKVSALLVKRKENIPILIKVFSGGALIQARLIEIN